jgi:hypothetical protein
VLQIWRFEDLEGRELENTKYKRILNSEKNYFYCIWFGLGRL